MIFSVLADLAVVFHIMLVLFVLFGGLAVVRRPYLAWLHLPAAVWGTFIEFKGSICPLTYLENYFRHLEGKADYSGSFVEHYLEPLLYPLGLTTRSQTMMGMVVLGLNAATYGYLWWKRSHPSR